MINEKQYIKTVYFFIIIFGIEFFYLVLNIEKTLIMPPNSIHYVNYMQNKLINTQINKVLEKKILEFVILFSLKQSIIMLLCNSIMMRRTFIINDFLFHYL
jgi:hypothetical protein